MFSGDTIDPEIWEDCHAEKWQPWIELFLPLINNHHGYFQHLPFRGAWMDQPAITMRILMAIQASYFAYLQKVNSIGGRGA
jgi:hypothetical protein